MANIPLQTIQFPGLSDTYTIYQIPSGGIPSTDMSSSVQTSLGLADTAVQPSALDFIVNLTPTALDYSGVMDKTVAEIYTAAQAHKRIIFRVWTAVDDYVDVVATMVWKDGDFIYPSFNAFIIDESSDSIIYAYTGSSDDGTRADYGTKIYNINLSDYTTTTDVQDILANGTAKKSAGVLVGEFGSDSTTTALTASITGVTAYYTGLTVYLTNLPARVASTGTYTLNVSSVGAKNIYIGGGGDSEATVYGALTAGSDYFFIYDETLNSNAGGWYCVTGQNSDSTFWATYGVTTSAEIEAAHQANKNILCFYSNRVYRFCYRTSATSHTFSYTYSSTIYRLTCSANSWSTAETAMQLNTITSDTTLASGDKFVFIDSSDSSKLKRSSISIGSSTTKYLANNGTWQNIPSVPTASDATPQSPGTASAGSSTDYSRADHIHAKELPTVTSSDNGKFLGVSNGAWDVVSIPAPTSSSTPISSSSTDSTFPTSKAVWDLFNSIVNANNISY